MRISIPKNVPIDVRRCLQKMAAALDEGRTPRFKSVELSDLTATRLVASDADKTLESTNLSDWIAGTTNEITITDDGDGTVTIGIPDPLIVAKGGTGAATLTDHSILLGSGTSAITALGAATNGQLPIGSTGADPVLATITGTANQITVTNGIGTITLSLPQDYATDSTPTLGGLTIVNAITEFSVDGTLGGDSDSALPTEKAVKAYVDAAVGGTSNYAFKTITGITNDVVADAVDDTLTLASTDAKLTIVGTAGTDTITFTVDETQISHDNLSEFVANEHVDHTSVTLTAGTGLTGGGDISSNRTFAVDGVLEDLDTLGANSADSEFLVGTGAGTLAWESGATARTSIGLGIADSPQFTGLTLTGNLTLPDGGTVGNGSLLTFDDTGNTLELTGATFQVFSAAATYRLQCLDMQEGGLAIIDAQTTYGDDVICSLRAYESTFVETLFGLSMSGVSLLFFQPQTTGAVIGTYTNFPLIFGVNNTEHSRLTATTFQPASDNALDLGAIGGTDYRWKDLYLSGSLSDETNSLTIANAKAAYDHSQIAAGDSVHVSTTENTNWDTAYTHSQLTSGNPHSVTPAELSLVIGTDVLAQQAIGIADDNLLEVDGTPNSGEYARFTANGLEGRTAVEAKTDLSLNLVENTALSTWAGTANITTLGTVGTGTWQGSSISITYTDAKCTDATADNTAANETSHSDVIVDSDFGSAGLCKTDGAGTYSVITDSSTNWDAAYTHVSNNGTDHSYIGQDVTTSGTPQFTKLGVGIAPGANYTYLQGPNDGSVILEVDDAVTSLFRIKTGETVFTEDTRDQDFRIESAVDSHSFFLQGSDGYIGLGVSAPSYKLSIGSTNTLDQVGIYHDNTDAYFTTTDGSFIFLTDEGTNTHSYVMVKGKGTGFGGFFVYDEDDAENCGFYCSNGYGHLRVYGTSPSGLILQADAECSVGCFGSCSEGETQKFRITGHRTGDVKRNLEIEVGADAADTASFDGLSNYRFDGNIEVPEDAAIKLVGGSLALTFDGTDGQIETTGLFYATSGVRHPNNVGLYWNGAVAGVNGWILDNNDRMLFTAGGTEVFRIDDEGNIGLRQADHAAGATGVFSMANATAPGAGIANGCQQYSADYAAGEACFHTMDETGDIIKLRQQKKVNYNNWAAFTDVVDALVAMGIFDAA